MLKSTANFIIQTILTHFSGFLLLPTKSVFFAFFYVKRQLNKTKLQATE